MNKQHILGRLTPTTPKAITKRTYRHIYEAVTKNKLYGIVFAENWEEGIFTLNNDTPNVPAEECSSALEFITRLTNLINTKGIVELGLKGEVIVMVPKLKNPVVFRLIVENGEVLHQHANLVWDEKRPLF
jgi:hypothetical protein